MASETLQSYLPPLATAPGIEYAPSLPLSLSSFSPSPLNMSASNSSASSSSSSFRHNHPAASALALGPTHVSPTQACAACKYQRRKCTVECVLAPFFPADKPQQFLSAHRLFGVSNILKIIRNLNDADRTAAMRNIIFQSNLRAQDPVAGCYRLILDLQNQVDRAEYILAQHSRFLNALRQRDQENNYPHYMFGADNGSIIIGHEMDIPPPPESDLAHDLLQRENGEVERIQMDIYEPLQEMVEREEDHKVKPTLDLGIMPKYDMATEHQVMYGQVQLHGIDGVTTMLKLTNSEPSGM